MEVENTNGNGADDNEVVEEFDVFLRIPKKDLFMLQYPLRPSETGLTNYETIEKIHSKKLQKTLSMTVSISKECQSFSTKDKEAFKYDLVSKLINNRTNYCVGKIDREEKSLVLLPVNTCLQMRKSFADKDEKDTKVLKKPQETEKKETELEEVNQQLKRKENLKQIERKLRTYRFQKELLDSEKEVELRFEGDQSMESKKFIASLFKPVGKNYQELKPLDKNEYLKYLF